MMTGWRTWWAVIAALLIAVTIVRNASVELSAQSSPVTAARAWPTHPDAEIALAMTEIAQAARSGRDVPAATFDLLRRAAEQDPLAPEPYLARGVQAKLQGDTVIAERAFKAAQWRDPRSLPAAYFLADAYVRSGDIDRGLTQIAALARLSPGGTRIVGPYLASFAARPANWPALRKAFRANPELAAPTLDALAAKSATVPALLALTGPQDFTAHASWLPSLLNTLVETGQYARAQSIWAQASRVRRGETVHDASFADKSSPPPFNWSLTTSSVGLAERQTGGRLHVIFYGQEDGILASQLVLLQPGSYRLSHKLLGGGTGEPSLNWSIWCDKAAAPIASITVNQVADRGWQFTIPRNCPAQWLRLSGAAGDLAQQIDLTIGSVSLTRMGNA